MILSAVLAVTVSGESVLKILKQNIIYYNVHTKEG